LAFAEAADIGRPCQSRLADKSLWKLRAHLARGKFLKAYPIIIKIMATYKFLLT
jgi:hypothetical protein